MIIYAQNIVNINGTKYKTRSQKIRIYDRKIRILHKKIVMDFHKIVQDKIQEDLNIILTPNKNDDVEIQEKDE